MPKLRGENIPPGAGVTPQTLNVRDDELLIDCPRVRDKCDWQTVRPLRACHSAQVAHMIQHAKGMLPNPGQPLVNNPAPIRRAPTRSRPRSAAWDEREDSTWIDRM